MNRRIAVLLACVLASAVGCARKPAPPPSPHVPEHAGPAPVDSAVSDVATGGSWEEGGKSGPIRVVVRSGGRRNMKSEVVLQWLRWDDRSEQPIEVKSVPITELSRGGIMVTASRIDEEEGRPVVKLSLANVVTGIEGEARVWPQGVGRYRAKLKWVNEAQ
jgi:hypothetical protein